MSRSIFDVIGRFEKVEQEACYVSCQKANLPSCATFYERYLFILFTLTEFLFKFAYCSSNRVIHV